MLLKERGHNLWYKSPFRNENEPSFKVNRSINQSDDLTKRILSGGKVGFKDSLYSAEYKRNFSTEHSIAQIEPEPDKPSKLRLVIDGVDIIEWFRMKYKEFQRSIGVTWTDRGETKGRKL